MTFTELLTEVQKTKCEEKRVQNQDYLEIVIAKDCLEPLSGILTSYFGQPLKSEGSIPCGEARRQSAAHGGIQKNQTMYFRQEGDLAECALLWPWGSGTRITVKIIQAKNFGLTGIRKGLLASLFGRK